MAYGPLAQCAFMSGPPRVGARFPPRDLNMQIWDEVPPFEIPPKCENPPKDAYTLYGIELKELKQDPTRYVPTRMPLDDYKAVVFGSSQNHEGQVFDGHKSVKGQNTALMFMKGKWLLKSINGNTTVESVSSHQYLRDKDGRAPKRYTNSSGRTKVTIGPVDPKRVLTRDMCTFRMGDSDKLWWVQGPLPLGEGEVEEVTEETKEKRRERRREKERGEREKDRGERGEREERGERKERSRSRRRERR
eukprot:gnl/MRDRNA2_/MRDRNA2_87375_c1_seq1.p1 gnl/MRDRNA2_/MRDRNA2_87375_c1~~gnl/MRDRNA2_/MRDRNA2_87375_c1_seq1.p1  ORF type:complete len:247 (+),score=46.93 gnl/MRDRNA2_/MRDRNA2_87375_c1_seq1:78-818(+)